MLTYDDALNLNYYKKTTFTGWQGGMRFLIKMEKVTIEEEAADGSLDENGQPAKTTREISRFHVWLWPGPYIYDLTPAEKKTENTFPFTNEGKRQAVDWINEQYTTRMREWPVLKTGD